MPLLSLLTSHGVVRRFRSACLAGLFAMVCLAGAGCSTGVEPSPDPGVLRVTLQADAGDNMLVVTGDTVVASDRDRFEVTVDQGRIYRGVTFATLFASLEDYRARAQKLNLLEGIETEPVTFTVFETYAPPGRYDSLLVGLTADQLKVGTFEIPVHLPRGEGAIVTFREPFEITSGDTTIVRLQIEPFASVVRFRDSYQFVRKIRVVNIEQR